MLTRAVIYARLSAASEDSTSIARQEADLRALADREGWEVVRVLADDGISGRKERPNADEALRMLREREAEALLVWKLDRWTRSGIRVVGELVDVLERTPGALFVALQDGLRSDAPTWRMTATILSEVARMESENTTTRVRSSIAFRLQHDRYIGGASIPFGYASAPVPPGTLPPGRVLVIDTTEAAIVREVASRILDDGEPMTRIAADLTARGVPTSKSPARRAARRGDPVGNLPRGRWTATTLRSLCTSETLLGRVTREGNVLRDADGLARTVWEPVLDHATFQALRTRLTPAPTDTPKPPRKRAARALSGLAYCGACSSRLYVTTSSGRPVYRCGSKWNGGACDVQLAVSAPLLEDLVAERFLSAVGHLPEYAVLPSEPSGPAAEALAAIEEALRETSDSMLADDADVTALVERMAALKARRASLRAEVEAVDTTPRPTGRTLGEAWASSMTMENRRELLLTVLDHVTVDPTPSRSRFLDPDRVRFYWYETPEDHGGESAGPRRRARS